MRRRFSGPGAALASAALFLGSAIALGGVAPADAAPAKPAKAKAAAAEPAPAAAREPKAAYSQAGPDDAAGCFTGRKKLFVEGEGWIVRRVTTCR